LGRIPRFLVRRDIGLRDRHVVLQKENSVGIIDNYRLEKQLNRSTTGTPILRSFNIAARAWRSAVLRRKNSPPAPSDLHDDNIRRVIFLPTSERALGS
jgi:hypothetical protein